MNIYDLLKQIGKKAMNDLLGHNSKVAALPEGAMSWFTGLDAILPGEVKVESKRWQTKSKILMQRSNSDKFTTNPMNLGLINGQVMMTSKQDLIAKQYVMSRTLYTERYMCQSLLAMLLIWYFCT